MSKELEQLLNQVNELRELYLNSKKAKTTGHIRHPQEKQRELRMMSSMILSGMITNSNGNMEDKWTKQLLITEYPELAVGAARRIYNIIERDTDNGTE